MAACADDVVHATEAEPSGQTPSPPTRPGRKSFLRRKLCTAPCPEVGPWGENADLHWWKDATLDA